MAGWLDWFAWLPVNLIHTHKRIWILKIFQIPNNLIVGKNFFTLTNCVCLCGCKRMKKTLKSGKPKGIFQFFFFEAKQPIWNENQTLCTVQWINDVCQMNTAPVYNHQPFIHSFNLLPLQAIALWLAQQE